MKSPTDSILREVKSGDKVVLTVKEGEDVSDLKTNMAKKNVDLEVRETQLEMINRFSNENSFDGGAIIFLNCVNALLCLSDNVIQLNPKQAFLDFLRINNSDTENSTPSLGNDSTEEFMLREITREGLSTIERLQGLVSATAFKSIDGSGSYNLSLESIDIKGFGIVPPF